MRKIWDVIRSNRFLVLDTETTGLDNKAEICQLAIIASDGEVLIDTLVKPINPIPDPAIRIHRITNEMVSRAPSFAQILPRLLPLLSEREIVIYNADYDRRLLYQSTAAAGLGVVQWSEMASWWCAMETFAPIYGDWSDYHHSYTWQKLVTAATHYRIPAKDAHNALGDCRMTLAVCKAMLAQHERSG